MLKHGLCDAGFMGLVARGLVSVVLIGAALLPPTIEAAVCSINSEGETQCPILGTVFSTSLVAKTTLTSASISLKTDVETSTISLSANDVTLTSGGEILRFHPENSVLNVYRDEVLVSQLSGGELVPAYRFAQLFGAATAPTPATGCSATTAWESVFADIRPGAVPSAPQTSLTLNATYRKHQFLSTEGPLRYLTDRAIDGNPGVGHGEDGWQYLNTDHYHISYQLRLGSDVLDSWTLNIYNSISTCV